MTEILPGDIAAVYWLHSLNPVSVLEWFLYPGQAGPGHVLLFENDFEDLHELRANYLLMREAVPPHVRCASFIRLYGAAIANGSIRVDIYRLREWSHVAVARGLEATRKAHPAGQLYNQGRLLMGLFPDPRKTVCSELCRTFIKAATGRDIPKLNWKDRALGLAYIPTVTPLHIVMAPQLIKLGTAVPDSVKGFVIS